MSPATQGAPSGGRRIGMVVAGATACVAGFVVLVFGGVVLILGLALGDERQRAVSSAGHAVVVGDVAGRAFEIGNASFEGSFELELRGTSDDGRTPVFIGVGPTAAVAAYLDDVDHTLDPVFTSAGGPPVIGLPADGSRAPAPPGALTFWDATASGPGEQTLTWPVRGAAWTFVVMRPSAESGVDVDLTTEVYAPLIDWAEGWLAPALLAAGALLVLGGLALIALGLLRGRRPPPPPEMGSPPDVDTPGPSPVGRF